MAGIAAGRRGRRGRSGLRYGQDRPPGLTGATGSRTAVLMQSQDGRSSPLPVLVASGQLPKLAACRSKVVDKALPPAARRGYILSCPEGPARSTPGQRFWRKRCQRSVRKPSGPQGFEDRTQNVHRGNRDVEGPVAGPAVAGAQSSADREVLGLLDRDGRSDRYARTRSPIERFLRALLCARTLAQPRLTRSPAG